MAWSTHTEKMERTTSYWVPALVGKVATKEEGRKQVWREWWRCIRERTGKRQKFICLGFLHDSALVSLSCVWIGVWIVVCMSTRTCVYALIQFQIGKIKDTQTLWCFLQRPHQLNTKQNGTPLSYNAIYTSEQRNTHWLQTCLSAWTSRWLNILNYLFVYEEPCYKIWSNGTHTWRKWLPTLQ